jgi:two-component system, LytTR family, sensor kinase
MPPKLGQIVEQTGDPANTVLKLSDLMHYQLSVHQKERMPLSDELQHLRNYIELEQMRWGDHLDIDFRIEGSTDNLMIEPLLLLPFVENAFKHGVEGLNERAKVLINVAIQQQTLYLYIENDRPLNTPTPYKTSGTGLDNVKRRLDLAYPKNHDLHVDSSNPQRFCITLSIHLNPNY